MALVTGLGILTSVYLSAGRAINDLIKDSSTVRELQEEMRLQIFLNQGFDKKLDSMDTKLDRLLYRTRNER